MTGEGKTYAETDRTFLTAVEQCSLLFAIRTSVCLATVALAMSAVVSRCLPFLALAAEPLFLVIRFASARAAAFAAPTANMLVRVDWVLALCLMVSMSDERVVLFVILRSLPKACELKHTAVEVRACHLPSVDGLRCNTP